MPICTKCEVDKPSEEFSKELRKANGLRSQCKVCRSAQNSARLQELYIPHPREPFTAEKAQASRQKWEEKNKEAAAEIRKRCTREYHKQNPHVKATHCSARRARLIGSIPKWATDEINREKEWRKANHGFHLDHIVPITPPLTHTLGAKPMSHWEKQRFIGPLIPIVYGFHVEANWQPLTQSENSAKGNKDWPCAPWHC